MGEICGQLYKLLFSFFGLATATVSLWPLGKRQQQSDFVKSDGEELIYHWEAGNGQDWIYNHRQNPKGETVCGSGDF